MYANYRSIVISKLSAFSDNTFKSESVFFKIYDENDVFFNIDALCVLLVFIMIQFLVFIHKKYGKKCYIRFLNIVNFTIW